MKITCRIWWDTQDQTNQGWCVEWHISNQDAEQSDEHADATLHGTRRCSLTTLRRRAWRSVDRSSLINTTRLAFSRAVWRWIAEDGGYWIATVERP